MDKKAANWHTLETETALRRLGVKGEQGLEASAAAARLREHGSNELLDRGAKSARGIRYIRQTEPSPAALSALSAAR